MALSATVLVPTHNHGPLLSLAVGSALRQTVDDIEVLIVGDGPTPETREVALELQASDERVRFFDNPKGPRHGEVHRHSALSEAGGEVVCYLSDDDLWLPDHVDNILAMLAHADFAHSLPMAVDGGGSLFSWTVDLGLDYYRAMLERGQNAIPLTTGAHTLAFYRQLPFGWRTTPHGTPTDLYMWQQILGVHGVVAVSGTTPNTLSFPATLRDHMSEPERLSELEAWADRLRDPRWLTGFRPIVLEVVTRERAEREALVAADRDAVHAASEHQRVEVDRFRAETAAANDRADAIGQELAEMASSNAVLAGQHDADQDRIRIIELARDEVIAELTSTKDELGGVYGSATWRLRNTIMRLPGVGKLVRYAARAMIRQGKP